MKTLKLNSSGEDVKLLQRLLNKRGYSVDVSGKFDAPTNKAVRQFQKEGCLSVDGIVEKDTWSLLLKMYLYNHTQLEIQNHIVNLWLKDPENEIDLSRAQYLKDHLIYEGGWCDGWAYTLMFHPEELLTMWENIDNAIDKKYELSLTDKYNAVQLARMASRYHIINNWKEDAKSLQLYNSLGYDADYRSKSIETWSHDIDTPLQIYEIKSKAKTLEVGHTLRLTSTNHDAAIYKKSAKEYIISETELAGVQLVDINELCTILENYSFMCDESMFFSQYLIK